jgi:hypothetical protein
VRPSGEIGYLLRVLSEVLDDFVGADLRSVGLRGASLEGLRWSDNTRWPSGWEEDIRAASVEIEPGVFKIHGFGRREDDRHEVTI